MGIKIERIKNFLGFGNGTKSGEYYHSSGMRSDRGGIKPGWRIVESCRSSTVASLDLVKWFDEREETGITPDVRIYAVDNGGDIFRVQDGLTDWSLVHTPGTTSHGNGLIVDHSSSQRLLYLQDQYVGAYDGVVWYDTWQDFGKSQNINRDSDLYEDWVVMCNGSSIALLNITDDSFNAAGFTMPDKFVAAAVKSGQNGILIGANFNNRGVLMLWDGNSDRSIAPWIWLDGEVKAIAKYKGAWVVSTGREYFVTNGYSILKTYKPIDMRIGQYNFGPTYPSGMVTEGDRLFLNSGPLGLPSRQKRGLYILDLLNDLWEFCPNSKFDTYTNASMGALFISSLNTRYVSYADTFVSPNQEYIGTVSDSANSSYFVSEEIGGSSPYKKKVEAVIIGLDYDFNDYLYEDEGDHPNWKITVKVYNFQGPLWGYAFPKQDGTARNQIVVDGDPQDSFNNAEVGDEITILEGVNAGEIRHITSIADRDTNDEVWVLDRSMSSTIEASVVMNVSPFKKVGEKTITDKDIKDNRLYIPIKSSIIGRKFLVKIVCENPYEAHMLPHISGVSVVYNELNL